MAAPAHNLNATKNGTRLRRLVVGEVPIPSAKREGRAYRRDLEAEVISIHGEIDVQAAHYIDTATAATLHAAICRWLLREKLEGMETSDVLACSREIVRAKQIRDKAIEALKLQTNESDPWAILDAPQPANGKPDDTSAIGADRPPEKPPEGEET